MLKQELLVKRQKALIMLVEKPWFAGAIMTELKVTYSQLTMILADLRRSGYNVKMNGANQRYID
jgi:hypothetical protein